ncbi:helix-turn-helix transcriptional regulator [Streptomyces sp. 8L]|uniref:helix-turn-helix transcriptional regulator n=1 Tax=Streptomyces sp. 8L TaxID=2877242 RepID=UPI001CD52415|nr:helix-turn-helix domain-containing protein [Streptomyces sp. 8L]MCA1223562.1 helix-turn-helix domain-containing protein [Streptomyces sp. 8L]
MDLTGYLTSDEAAAHLGINRQSLYNLAKQEDFPAPKKIGRTSLWPVRELDQWRERHPKRDRRDRP